jgi:hypothetical protein
VNADLYLGKHPERENPAALTIFYENSHLKSFPNLSLMPYNKILNIRSRALDCLENMTSATGNSLTLNPDFFKKEDDHD